MPDGINHQAFYSGDVLLSHGLSPYYHRGCSVSLPCSEWERVGPLRQSHQTELLVVASKLGLVAALSRRVIGDWLIVDRLPILRPITFH